MPAAGHLAIAWSARLGGAVYGQPLVIGGTVVAATETDEIYGLDLATGAVRWHVRAGTPVPLSRQPCGDLDPLGITGTGVYDPQTQLAYFVAQSGPAEHLLIGVDPANGSVRFRRSVPSPDHEPSYDQQRGALALTDGQVYVVFGGHFGDCGPYIGSVVSVPASGSGSIRSYLVPTAKQGGIWASGGPVIGPDGTIYVSAGNGATVSSSYDGSDSVTALTPQLTRVGIFGPANWRMLSADDLDLGSSSPALLTDGRILQVGKQGVGYLLDAAHLGGVGGQLAKAQVRCAAVRRPGRTRDRGVPALPDRPGRRGHVRRPPAGALARPGGRRRVAGAGRRRGMGGQTGTRALCTSSRPVPEPSASRSAWVAGCRISPRPACPAPSSWSAR